MKESAEELVFTLFLVERGKPRISDKRCGAKAFWKKAWELETQYSQLLSFYCTLSWVSNCLQHIISSHFPDKIMEFAPLLLCFWTNTVLYIYWKVKKRLQDTGVIKISSHISNCCPHLHQWLLGGMKQQNGHSLPQLSHNLLLLLPSLPADLPPKLGDHLQRFLVPPTKSVHKKRNEHNTLCLTPVAVLSHLDV